MTDERPSQPSIDVAIAALEKGRRAGWARAYALERELAECRQELARVIQSANESARLNRYSSRVLRVIAPSLVPWLNGGDPGVCTFGWGNGPARQFGSNGRSEYFEACGSDDPDALEKAGARDAESWLALDSDSRKRQDWRAHQMLAWYDDWDADTPRCEACGRATWEHSGPDEPCLSLAAD